MPRWTAAALLVLAAGIAHADDLRTFPPAAMRGSLVVVTPPDVVLDGNDVRLSIGARIRDAHNLLITSATLADGTAHPVIYLADGTGQLSQVWVLSAEEAAVYPAASSPWYRRFLGL